MGINFSLKLAWRNIQSNKQIYLPYTISAMITVAIFQMMSSLMTNPFVEERSSLLPQLFALGTVVVAFFSIIFIFYTNSFLMKRRKKELGLYNILGLEKKHIRRVLWMESTILGVISIVFGLIVGNLLGQLGFLFLNYLLKLPTAMEYTLSSQSVLFTVILFIGVFFLAFIYNATQVTLANPIKLLKSGKEGEKEPKSSPILFLLGLLSLGAGYFISIRIEDPISALIQFFLAVLLVIVGTYLLFTAGSIIILKMLKRNRSFYYQPGPFISVSGMLYRMKQHAAGLANITILSTMVIIAISTTVTLFVGTEETLSNRFPEENSATIRTNYGTDGATLTTGLDQLTDHVTAITEDENLKIESQLAFKYMNIFGDFNENHFTTRDNNADGGLPQLLILLPLEDYNRTAGESEELAANEILVRTAGLKEDFDQFELGGRMYDVRELDDLPFFLDANVNLVDTLIAVVPNAQTVDEIAAFYNPNADEYLTNWEANIFWTTNAADEDNVAYSEIINQKIGDHGLDLGVFYESRSANREEWYSMNGGFLFLGLFLGGLFTIGAALITYFKQVSEGYDDRERIQIMQKVGLDKETTRKATRSQIVWMFTLPILVASLHAAFAFPILQKMVILFGITSKMLLLSVTVGVVIGFALIYWLIYRITSIVYLNIVE